jgi:hypothetical protein
MRARLPLLALALLACGAPEDTDEIVFDDPVELPPPDLEGVDLEAAFTDAFRLMAAVDLRAGWAGHVDALERRRAGCPDIYLGNPDIEGIDLDGDARGYAWRDFCRQGDEIEWGGFAFWETEAGVQGDPTTAEGRTIEAERLLFADALVGQGDEVLFAFDGEGTDALTRTDAADGYEAWTYTSRVQGTVSGTLAFPAEVTSTAMATPGGYRTDLYRRATGGVDASLEARGNVYLFEHRIQDRFDSLGLDLELKGPAGAGPEDCTAEPRGWIALRDEDAFWYDLVFEPRYDGDPDDPDYPNDPYSECDGCGTLYVRGLEQEGIEVCVDLSFLWDGALAPPSADAFAFTLRDPGEAP